MPNSVQAIKIADCDCPPSTTRGVCWRAFLATYREPGAVSLSPASALGLRVTHRAVATGQQAQSAKVAKGSTILVDRGAASLMRCGTAWLRASRPKHIAICSAAMSMRCAPGAAAATRRGLTWQLPYGSFHREVDERRSAQPATRRDHGGGRFDAAAFPRTWSTTTWSTSRAGQSWIRGTPEGTSPLNFGRIQTPRDRTPARRVPNLEWCRTC